MPLRILVSASAPPVSVEFKLKDLGSRLASGPIWKLKPLDDDDLLAALQMRSRWRGLELTDEAGRYLLRRATRSIKALFEIFCYSSVISSFVNISFVDWQSSFESVSSFVNWGEIALLFKRLFLFKPESLFSSIFSIICTCSGAN